MAAIPHGRCDRAMGNQRVPLEIHLRDQALAETLAIDRKVDMHRAPIIGTVRPGICARPYREEFIIAAFVRERAATSTEIRVERSEIGILDMPVAPASICLPNLDKRIRHWAAILIQYAAMHKNALTHGRCQPLGPV